MSKTTRDESLRSLSATGAKAYAIGFGQQTDRTYLDALATQTGGVSWHVGDQQSSALLALFADIGGVLGAAEVIRADVPVLATGAHTVSLRGRINGTPVSATQTFRVTNDGLIAPAVRPSTGGDALITVDLNAIVPARDLGLTAHIDELELTVDPATDTVLIDPWALVAGSRTLRVVAHAGEDTAFDASLPVAIPALSARLDVRTDTDGGATARGRVQGDPSPMIVALAGGQEIARSTKGPLSVTSGQASGLVTFRLLDSSGVAQAEQATQITSPAMNPLVLPMFAGAALLALALTALYVRRARQRRPLIVDAVPRAHPVGRRFGRAETSRTEPPPESAVFVVSPSGAEQVFHVNGRPLTIGASPDCDIVLEGDDVRDVHGRITPMAGGDLMLHSLHEADARPYVKGPGDEWLLLRRGEEITIGRYVLRFQAQAGL